MIVSTRFVFPIPLSVALTALVCGGAMAQDNEGGAATDTASKSALELLVPPELPSVEFGEPIYVPLAIRNASNKGVIATSFRNAVPEFIYVVRTGSEWAECLGYGAQFGNGGDFQELPPNSVETTVLLINIWSPAVALKFRKTGEARIDFSAFLPIEPEQRTIAFDQRPALRATTTVRLLRTDDPFEGSAFTEPGEERMFALARMLIAQKIIEDDDSPDQLTAGSALSDAFAAGQSPLNWLDPRRDRQDSRDVESKFYKAAKAMVRPDSALYRMMAFTELRYELRGVNPTPTRTSLETLYAYFELLEHCHHSERHYQIVALNGIRDPTAIPYAVREPDLNWPELCAELRRRLPTYSMYFNPHIPRYSTVSLLGHSGVTASVGATDDSDER